MTYRSSVGLTNIGDVVGYEKENGKVIAVPGRLIYRELILRQLHMASEREEHGFDETVFLLLTGRLPSKQRLKSSPPCWLH